MRPLAPEVNPGGLFDKIGNVGAANASGNFEEVQAIIPMTLEKFGVCDTADEIQALNDPLV